MTSATGQQISPSTVYRVLKKNKYGVYKRTVKPGLTKEARKARYDWCYERKDWTLEQWKRVIWTDETSVQLGGVRGRRRVWRLEEEAYDTHCIVHRWKGFSEFMWWSCFSYDKKGPGFVWPKETQKEKEEMEADLAQRNQEKYEEDKQMWELTNGIRRLRATSTAPGKKPVFRHNEATGAYVVKEGSTGKLHTLPRLPLLTSLLGIGTRSTFLNLS